MEINELARLKRMPSRLSPHGESGLKLGIDPEPDEQA